jgi:hypothetical protein
MNLNLKKIFDWSISSVEEPKGVSYRPDDDGWYVVTVNYVHHGKIKRTFNRDGFCYSAYDKNRDRAWKYYGKMSKKIKKQQLNENSK